MGLVWRKDDLLTLSEKQLSMANETCQQKIYAGIDVELSGGTEHFSLETHDQANIESMFTAVTLGCGFKGGEIVPTLFVGSTFGCAAGALLGLPAGFAAALGITGLFCGMTNCPLTSLLISVELFGADGLLCYAVVCAVSYVCSGYRGLYSSQTILYSKLRAEFINVHTKE